MTGNLAVVRRLYQGFSEKTKHIFAESCTRMWSRSHHPDRLWPIPLMFLWIGVASTMACPGLVRLLGPELGARSLTVTIVA